MMIENGLTFLVLMFLFGVGWFFLFDTLRKMSDNMIAMHQLQLDIYAKLREIHEDIRKMSKEGRNDDIGFVATTTISSPGGYYLFEFYHVQDAAKALVDGEIVLNSTGWDSEDVFLSEGKHTLQITYEETCCGASIGFQINETLYCCTGKTVAFLSSSIFWLLIGMTAAVVVLISLFFLGKKP